MTTSRTKTTADTPKDDAPDTPLQAEWVANEAITVDIKKNGRVVDQLRFGPGDPCLGVPENWPPAWLVDDGLVSRASDSA